MPQRLVSIWLGLCAGLVIFVHAEIQREALMIDDHVHLIHILERDRTSGFLLGFFASHVLLSPTVLAKSCRALFYLLRGVFF